jgi:hypothetical protein
MTPYGNRAGKKLEKNATSDCPEGETERVRIIYEPG